MQSCCRDRSFIRPTKAQSCPWARYQGVCFAILADDTQSSTRAMHLSMEAVAILT